MTAPSFMEHSVSLRSSSPLPSSPHDSRHEASARSTYS